MKFRITKEHFLEGLQQVQHVVSTRATLPILSNVLIETNGDGLNLTTTDLDVGVSGRVAAEITAPGATTLPARKLATIIRELPEAMIDISVDAKNVATIKSGGSNIKILGLGQDEFPPFPDFENAREFKLQQKTLKESLKMTSYAISTDETRYVLNGILFSFKDGKLTMVATDGRRLAMVDHEVEFPESQETEVIIPTKAVNELQRLLSDTGEVAIQISENQASFRLNENVLVSKLIEGNYPNFRQVIPKEAKKRIVLDRESFYEVVKRVSLLASDKSNSIRLEFSDDNIDLISSSDVGEAKESIAVKYDGETYAIAFNPEFLIAPLRNLDSDEVYLDLIDAMSPGVLRIKGSFLYVLMPMRTTQ